MTFVELAVSILLAVASVLLPLVLFGGLVAICVYVARWWKGGGTRGRK